ncbi:MAG TPA: SelB C-terminal domain-containing protein, partial [Burkholderiales bacterium]|nr:SelB C-terminal domain-containing protein [Burkholderiales bacterium]
GHEVRVRGLQKRGSAAETASAGERCALNLTGPDLEDVTRGDWVLAAPLHRPTRRIDARVTVLASEAQPLKHWTPVHLHLATSDVTARLAIRRGAALAPGASEVVQLILDKPVSALRGDRFILRDQSATRTLGGGIVIDPIAPSARRSSAARRVELEALEASDPADALSHFVAHPDCLVDLPRFEMLYNLVPDRARALYSAAGLVQLGKERPFGVTRARHDAIAASILSALAEFHRRQPQAAGLDIDTLRGEVAPSLPPEPFLALLRELADARKVEVNSNLTRIPGHNATANAADEKLWQTVQPALESAGYAPPPVAELAAQLKLKEPILRDFLHRKAKGGDVQKVTADRFYPRTTLAALAAIAQNTAQQQPNGTFTAAQYRDATGTGRSLAIEILEHLDRLGITQRIGDARKMRRDYVPLLGAAPPLKPPPKPAAPAKAPGPQQRRPFPPPRKR